MPNVTEPSLPTSGVSHAPPVPYWLPAALVLVRTIVLNVQTTLPVEVSATSTAIETGRGPGTYGGAGARLRVPSTELPW
jgi:hypothetical protein